MSKSTDLELTIEQALAYQDAMVADGWTLSPLYDKAYSRGRSVKLERDGYVVQMYYAGNALVKDGHAMIAGYGPDRLYVQMPIPYSYEAMQANLNKCMECGVVGSTRRLGFAGRVCPECRVKYAPIVERPGWCD